MRARRRSGRFSGVAEPAGRTLEHGRADRERLAVLRQHQTNLTDPDEIADDDETPDPYDLQMMALLEKLAR